MLDFIPLEAMAGLQILSGLAIAVFWVSFFASESDFSEMPEGHLLYERSFVWPDGLIVIVLFVSAALLWAGHPLGESLSLVAGGMLLFLGVIDLSYGIANAMYKPPRGSMGSFFSMTASIVVVALVVIVRFL